jgi:large subunit ribosomal protein L16
MTHNLNFQVRFFSIKRHKGRVSKVPMILPKQLGEYGILTIEPARISSAQISSVILTLKRKLPSGTSIIPRIYGHLPVTEKPLEVRMGKGKGSIAKKVARVRAYSILFEITKISKTIPQEQYLDALYAAASKLPVRTKVLKY